jgi:hypothetical protein
MAFKQKGWSAFTKPEVASPLTDPTDKIKKKFQPKRTEITAAMEEEIPGASYEEGTASYQGDPDLQDKYTAEEIASGAGASADFFGIESGGHRTALGVEIGTRPTKTRMDRTGLVVGGEGKVPTLEITKKTGKAKKVKDVGKRNILTGNLSMQLDTLSEKDRKADVRGRTAEKETGEYVWNTTASDDVPWSFEGPMDDNIADKDLSDKKRRAKLNTKTGLIEEQYRTTLGTWRTTGRTLNQGAPDPAYVDAAQENIQDAADWEAGEEQRKIDADAQKEKKKLDSAAQKEAANAAREAGKKSYMWNGVEHHFEPKYL